MLLYVVEFCIVVLYIVEFWDVGILIVVSHVRRIESGRGHKRRLHLFRIMLNAPLTPPILYPDLHPVELCLLLLLVPICLELTVVQL